MHWQGVQFFLLKFTPNQNLTRVVLNLSEGREFILRNTDNFNGFLKSLCKTEIIKILTALFSARRSGAGDQPQRSGLFP
jgi:hypothetical protein